MMNRCHPSPDERNQIRHLVDTVGAVEILRVLGQIIAHDHPSLEEGMKFRGLLMKIARDIDAQPEPAKEEGQWIALDLPGKRQLDRERRTAESFMGATLVDVLIVTDDDKGKRLETGYMKVIGGVYCDWSDCPLSHRNVPAIVNGLSYDTWEGIDGQTILIPTEAATKS